MAWLSRHRRTLGLALTLGVVLVTFVVVLPGVADYGVVWRLVRGLEPRWLAVLGAATVLNVVTFAPPWMVALPGLRFRQALPFTQASTAVTFAVPGGGLVGMAGSFALLRSWGFARRDVARAVTLTGVWNQLSNLLLPVVAIFLLSAEEETDAALVTLAFVGAVIFGVVVLALALVLWRVELARSIGDLAASVATRLLRLVGRRAVSWSGASFARFRDETVGLLRRRWPLLTLAALAGNLAVFAVLLGSARSVGIGASELTWIELFAGWSVGRVLGLIPVTPGGLGVVELGLIGSLVGFGGDSAQVVAATLLYRVLTIAPTLVLGGLTMLVWRRLRPDRAGVGPPVVNRPPE